MDELIKLLHDAFPKIDFENNTNLVYSGLIDSLDIVEIIAMLEEKYHIKIAPDDIDPTNFANVETLWIMINKYI